jgi:hypothetical protein
VILEYPTYLNVILLKVFLPKTAHTHTVSLTWCCLKHTLAKITTWTRRPTMWSQCGQICINSLSKKAKKLSNPAANTEKISVTPNAFQILDVEESSYGNDQNSKEANHPRGPSKKSIHRRKLPKFKGKGLREVPVTMWLP